MFGLNLKRKAKDNQEIVAAEKKQTKFLFKTKLMPGHKMFELHVPTGEIKEANVDRWSQVGKDGKSHPRSKININKDCIYAPGLNEKNAIKRFKKMGVL